MSKGDLIVERGAQRLQALAGRAAARGDGVGEWLAEELRNDAAFLRKLKPSLIAARARGQAPTSPAAPTPTQTAPPSAPSQPQLGPRPGRRSSGPPTLLVVAAAIAAGVLVAKIIDWRGHAHPRD